MRLVPGYLIGFMFSLCLTAAFAVEESSGVRPAIAFPPTPTPAVKEEPLDQAGLDAHLIPTQFLARTSDVLALVYNGFRRSQIDPCGCVSHQLGGLAKEGTLVHRIDELKIPAVQVDAGGYFKDMADLKLIEQTKYLMKGLGKLGYDALNVGFTELVIPPAELKKIANEAGVKVISANILDGTGKNLFEPYTITEVKLADGSPLKVGIIGVTRPRIEVAAGPPSAADIVANSGSSETVTVTSASEAINKYIDEVRSKSDFVVVLDYDRRTNAEELVKSFKSPGLVDVLVLGENAQIQGSAQVLDGVQVVSGGYEGRQLGTMYVELKDHKVVNQWSKHIEVLQTIPSDPEIDALVKEFHANHPDAGTTTPATGPTPAAPAKLDLGI